MGTEHSWKCFSLEKSGSRIPIIQTQENVEKLRVAIVRSARTSVMSPSTCLGLSDVKTSDNLTQTSLF
jgi:hypothetical protein